MYGFMDIYRLSSESLGGLYRRIIDWVHEYNPPADVVPQALAIVQEHMKRELLEKGIEPATHVGIIKRNDENTS
jgi:hypothetical protein